MNKMNIEKWKIRNKSHYIVAVFLIASVTAAALYITAAQNAGILRQQEYQKQHSPPARNEERGTRREKAEEEEQTAVINETTASCNLFNFQANGFTTTPRLRCSFMMGEYACQKYGRKDLRYRNWRWQLRHYDLPRFNGTSLLEKRRGKRLVFVGDLLNKNQWTWMLCLIESSLTQSSNKWGSFGSSDAIYKKVKMRLRLYEMALNTWSDSLEVNVNRTKTKLFFMSLSPIHTHGESWNVQQNCYNETEPISKEGYWGVRTDRNMMNIVELTIKKLAMRGVRIEYLKITHLSDYRLDAHPSIYKNFH